jgi:peptidoglycan L-alanyl-D-glutamate endopeptidase CwlK
MITLSPASEVKLKGVHPDLVRVVRRAAAMCEQPFIVFEGVRTVERQRSLIAKGVSKLKNPFRSRHVPTKDPKYGLVSHAVDLVPLNAGGQPVWDWKLIPAVLRAMKSAALAEHVTIECGAEWKTFKDGVHYQLPWRLYP